MFKKCGDDCVEHFKKSFKDTGYTFRFTYIRNFTSAWRVQFPSEALQDPRTLRRKSSLWEVADWRNWMNCFRVNPEEFATGNEKCFSRTPKELLTICSLVASFANDEAVSRDVKPMARRKTRTLCLLGMFLARLRAASAALKMRKKKDYLIS